MCNVYIYSIFYIENSKVCHEAFNSLLTESVDKMVKKEKGKKRNDSRIALIGPTRRAESSTNNYAFKKLDANKAVKKYDLLKVGNLGW